MCKLNKMKAESIVLRVSGLLAQLAVLSTGTAVQKHMTLEKTK